MAADRNAIERFHVDDEARLMDEHHYEEWLAVWAEDDGERGMRSKAVLLLDDAEPLSNVLFLS